MSRFTVWQCVHFIYVISDKEASIGIHSFDFVFCAKVCCYLGLPEPLQQVQAGRGEGLLPVHEHGARLPWLTSQTGKQKREREREREITVSLCCGRLWIVFTVSDNEISDVCVRIDLQHNTFHYIIKHCSRGARKRSLGGLIKLYRLPFDYKYSTYFINARRCTTV